jgi:phosphoglycerol transferase MdoB-like AlkP superfamily enzyme
MRDSKNINKKTNLPKRLWNFIWGDSQLPELLNINTKLSTFNKILNVTWFVFLLISLVTSSLSIYLIVTLPILILAFCCIIILFRKEFGKQRFIHLAITIFMMLLSQEWVDLPSYLKNDYKTVEGIPTKFEFHMPRYGPRYWEVIVDEVNLSMPEKIKDESSERWFVIHYLPHSKFIIDYKILTKAGTRTKLHTLK